MTDQTNSLQRYQNQILQVTSYIYRTYRSNLKIPDDLTNYSFPSEGPITSADELHILNRLFKSRSYLLIRTQNTLYTLGLWLLFGLPELVIDVTDIETPEAEPDEDDLDNLNNSPKPTTDLPDHDLERMVSPIIKAYIAKSDPPRVVNENNHLRILRSYDHPDQDLTFDSSDQTTTLNLRRVPEDEYISLNAAYLIWFYTYYVKADDNRNIVMSEEDSKVVEEHDGLEYQLYPIYHTTIPHQSLKDLVPIPNQTQISNLVDQYLGMDADDFSSDSFDDIPSEDTLE
jgi:hypothetical protein